MKAKAPALSILLLQALVLGACDSGGGMAPSSSVTGIGNPGGSPPGTGTTGTSVTPTLDAEEASFLGLINAYRAQNGAPSLRASAALTLSSKWMSQDMATKNYFDHTDSLGRDPFTRMAAFGYGYATSLGENIAAGNATAQDTFTQWKDSPAHNQNMLDAQYLAIGIGRYYMQGSQYGWYWTTDFGGVVDQALNQ